MNNERVRSNNAQRSSHFKALKLAVRHDDTQAIEREVRFLSIRSYKPSDVGFSVDDLYHHVENVFIALNGDGEKRRGLRAVYSYKQAQLLKLRRRIGKCPNGIGVRPSDIQRRDELTADLRNIGQKLRYYERILSIVNEQLKARGVVVETSGTLEAEHTDVHVHA